MSKTIVDANDWKTIYGDTGPPVEIIREAVIRVYDDWCDMSLKQAEPRPLNCCIDETDGVRHFAIIDRDATSIAFTIHTSSEMKAWVSAALCLEYGNAIDGTDRLGPYTFLSAVYRMFEESGCFQTIVIDEADEIDSIFGTGRLTKASLPQ